MMSLVSQVYDYYLRPYFGEKGQDLVEYALLLAIVVAIGWLIWDQQGLKRILLIFSTMLLRLPLMLLLILSLVLNNNYWSIGSTKEPLLRQEFFGQGSSVCLLLCPKN